MVRKSEKHQTKHSQIQKILSPKDAILTVKVLSGKIGVEDEFFFQLHLVKEYVNASLPCKDTSRSTNIGVC